MNHPKHLSRRSFLQTSAALGFSAPLLLTSGCQTPGKRTAANERINVGIIGTGKIAQSHFSGLLPRKDVQIVAVCDVDTTRREDAKKRVETQYAKAAEQSAYKGCATYIDFRELLARKDIDAVVICTPDHWHAILAIAACAAGKDVYCEKPLSLTIHEARAMVNAARKYKRVFQTGSQQRSSKEFRVACELVRNGCIGTVLSVDVGVGGPSKFCDLPEEPMEPGLDWNFWLGQAPVRPYNSILSPRGVHNHFPAWRSYIEYSGGGMTDWGAHHFDIAQWGLGMDNSGPIRITPPADPKADHGVQYLYENGVKMTHVNENGVTFFGTEGKIFVNRGKFKFWRGTEVKAEERGDLVPVEKEFLTNAKVRLYNSQDHRTDWLECIRTRKRPICDVEIGCRSVTVCHLGNHAYWHRRELFWDPKHEKYIGDSEANTWLTRAQRAPWHVA